MFHIILHQPEIPQNTGSIGRLCVNNGAKLHLIHPLGFEVSDYYLRRAGLDYWEKLAPTHYTDWEDFLARNPAKRLWLFHRSLNLAQAAAIGLYEALRQTEGW